MPTTNGVSAVVGRDRRDRRRDRARSRVARARAAPARRKSWGRCAPTPTSRTPRARRCRRCPAAPGTVVTSPAAPVAAGDLEHADRGRSPAGRRGRQHPGPEAAAAPSSPGRTGSATSLHPDDTRGAVLRSARSREVRPGSEVVSLLVPTRCQPTTSLRASPRAPASSALSSTTRRPPPSSGTRITMPRPSLVTSSGPSPVRGFIAAIRAPSFACQGQTSLRASPLRHRADHYPLWHGDMEHRADHLGTTLGSARAGRLSPCRPARHSSTCTATTCAPAAARRRSPPSSGCSTPSASPPPPSARRSRGWSCRAGSSRSSSAAVAATAPPSAPTAGSTRPATASTAGTCPAGTAAGTSRSSTRPTARAIRTRLRADLAFVGYAELVDNVWVSPFPRAELGSILERAGATARTAWADRFDPEPTGAWDLDPPARGVRRLAGLGRRAGRAAPRRPRRRGRGGVRGALPPRARVAEVPLRRPRPARRTAPATTGRGGTRPSCSRPRRPGSSPAPTASWPAASAPDRHAAHDRLPRAARRHRRRRHHHAEPPGGLQQPQHRDQGAAARHGPSRWPTTRPCAASC